jgi:alpha-glucosidase (family GH31 glycosyl hydrolase)
MAGDHASDFRGLNESLTGGLSLSTSGFSNWGSDVGGYLGKADEEVYLRWIEFGAFSPLMRFHGTEPREPWYYSDAAIGVYKKYAWLRENLLPYIYGSAQDTHATGIPLMRPLVFVGSEEYMFGDDLLVAPVHAPGEHKTISLPPGDWTEFWTGAPVKAGTIDITVPVDGIPVYIRAGAMIPIEVAPDFELGETMSGGRVAALIVTPPDSERTLHDWGLINGMKRIQLTSLKSGQGFDVKVENWSELQFMLLLGIRGELKSVTVDGQILPQLSLTELKSYPPGWGEIGHDQMIVRLPTAISHVVHFAVE